MTVEQDFAAFLTSYPREMAFGDEEPDVVFSRYFTDDLRFFNDGIELGRERLIAHARPARKNVSDLRVEVGETLVAADRAAARYVLHAEMRKGAVISTEIYMFAERADDGRISRVDQITRTLPAAKD